MNAPIAEIDTVCYIGAGTMGAGIAMAFANAGFEVQLLEINDDALGRGLENIARQYVGGIKRGKLTEAEAKHRRELINGTTSYDSLANVDLVIEAVFEDLSLKEQMVRDVAEAGREDVIFASNTSSISLTKLAAASSKPERVIGMHFFNPVPLMALVEVISGLATSLEPFELVAHLFEDRIVAVDDRINDLVGQVVRTA